MSKVCKKCGRTTEWEDRFCIHCGSPLEQDGPAQDPFVTAPEVTMKEREEDAEKNTAEVVSMGEYLLMLILLAIPVVNIIACLFWILDSTDNPNRKNFAKAWLIVTVISVILHCVAAYGLFRMILNMPTYIEHHMEYTPAEEDFISDFLTELHET